MQKFNILALTLSLFFIACSDDKIDSSLISSGAIMDEEAREIEQNLDKASYAELADLFLDTKDVAFDKDVLIVFGKNNCKYCDMLKDTIKNDANLKQIIKDNFNPYYINTSYTKTHNIDFGSKTSHIKTNDFASIFGINSTPAIIFLSKDGNVKYMYPGFTPQLKDLIINVTQKDSSMGNYVEIDKKIQNLKG
ncbi:hypothetical protein CCY99_02685 [Helicobacter sp. 16-1353]|uniref:thioredoxin fold domain-containing protein n=1 Tax=Helicobacter sp. 16-1353 TaxID=2004996 RepID=UPI000DCB6C0A|nr:thioredoxin fold domain-containing protein [Helicobacter sp. 16-1353]RAX54687.1 hypothetical protein CCY99_02685 [Helicobacter sp. 16-1353]